MIYTIQEKIIIKIDFFNSLTMDLKEDIFWDEITEIEYINPDDLDNCEYVYDFSVEDVETFATKEGLIVHNTLNSVDYNQKIMIRKNKKEIIITKIGKFIDKNIETYDKKYHTYFEKGDQTYVEVNKQEENYEIYAVGWDGKYKWCELQALTRHLPLVDGKRDNLIKITLESGRTTIGTKAKSFLRYNPLSNKLEECGGDKIKVSDYVPIMKKLDVEEQLNYLDLEEYFPKTKYLHGDEVVKTFEWKNEGIFESDYNKKRHWFTRFNGNKFTIPYTRSDTFIDEMKMRVKNSEIPKKEYIYHKKSTSKKYPLKLPKRFELDELFGFFIGSFLAEGLANKNQVKISNNDKEFREKIYDFCDKYEIGYYTTKRIFGDSDSKIIQCYTYRNRYENNEDLLTSYTEYVKTKNYNNGTSTDITIYNTMLSELLQKICNTGSKNKKVPQFCYSANDEFIKGILDGYLSGDGSLNKTTFYYCTISKDLGYGIALLLKRFGIHTKIYESENKFTKYYNFTLKNYQNFKYLKLTHLDKQLRMYKFLYKNERPLEYFNENILEMVIKKEEIESSHKYVYDLTVKDNPNFLLFNGISVNDTFHYSGVSSKSNVNQGVPRLKELINASKNPKTPSLTIHLPDEYNKSKDVAKKVLTQIQYTNILKLIRESNLWYDPDILNTVISEDKEFIRDYYDIFDDDIDFDNLSPWVLRIEMDRQSLLDIQITMYEIYDILLLTYGDKNIHIIYSDDNSEYLVFHFRYIHTDINLKDNTGKYITDYDQVRLKNLEQNINNVVLRGINGIQKTMFREIKKNVYKKDGSLYAQKEFVLDTTGTNLNEIMKFPYIDCVRTISNEIHEIYEMLGVEAARTALFTEINNVMQHSGIYINKRHVELLADVMTNKGYIMSIDRHGMNKSDSGPLAKCSFEETDDQLTKSGIFSRVDHMVSATSNIIMGQIANYGTGMVDIVFCEKTMKKYAKKDKTVKENKKKIIKLFD